MSILTGWVLLLLLVRLGLTSDGFNSAQSPPLTVFWIFVLASVGYQTLAQMFAPSIALDRVHCGEGAFDIRVVRGRFLAGLRKKACKTIVFADIANACVTPKSIELTLMPHASLSRRQQQLIVPDADFERLRQQLPHQGASLS